MKKGALDLAAKAPERSTTPSGAVLHHYLYYLSRQFSRVRTFRERDDRSGGAKALPGLRGASTPNGA